MAAPEGPGPSGYQYYSGNLADVGFGQVNPALYGEPKVVNYFNPVTGQYFTTATPLPETTVPEAWSAYVPKGTEIQSGFFKGLKTTTEAPDRSEYIPNALQSTGKGVATMAPAEEILAMRQGRPFGQSQQRQYGYRQPQQMPVRQAPAFRPDTSRLNGDFMDMIRKYADKSMMPALPKFQVSANQPQQFADGGPVAGANQIGTAAQYQDYLTQLNRPVGGFTVMPGTAEPSPISTTPFVPNPTGTLPKTENGYKIPEYDPNKDPMVARGYNRLMADPASLGFKTRECGPRGCMAFQVLGTVYNPTTGQYFETAAGNPFEVMPEGWLYTSAQGTIPQAGRPAPTPDPSLPGTPAPTPALPESRAGGFRFAPAKREDRRYQFERPAQPQQSRPQERPRFTPQGPGNNAGLDEALRGYRERSNAPALPPQQFAAGGSVMGQRGYSEMEASPSRVGFKKWTVPTKQVAVKGVMYNPTTGQYFEVDSSTPYQQVPEGWKFTMTPGSISTAGEASRPSEMAKLPEQYQQKAMTSIAENQQMMLDFLKKNRMGV